MTRRSTGEVAETTNCHFYTAPTSSESFTMTRKLNRFVATGLTLTMPHPYRTWRTLPKAALFSINQETIPIAAKRLRFGLTMEESPRLTCEKILIQEPQNGLTPTRFLQPLVSAMPSGMLNERMSQKASV